MIDLKGKFMKPLSVTRYSSVVTESPLRRLAERVRLPLPASKTFEFRSLMFGNRLNRVSTCADDFEP